MTNHKCSACTTIAVSYILLFDFLVYRIPFDFLVYLFIYFWKFHVDFLWNGVKFFSASLRIVKFFIELKEELERGLMKVRIFAVLFSCISNGFLFFGNGFTVISVKLKKNGAAFLFSYVENFLYVP